MVHYVKDPTLRYGQYRIRKGRRPYTFEDFCEAVNRRTGGDPVRRALDVGRGEGVNAPFMIREFVRQWVDENVSVRQIEQSRSKSEYLRFVSKT
jgi:hypothetical protein